MDWIRAKLSSLSEIKYLHVNVIIMQFMSMYAVPENASRLLKLLFHFWRFVCLFGLGSLAVLCLVDVYLRDEYVFVDVSSNFLNAGIFLGGCTRLVFYYAYDEKSKMIVERMNLSFRDESNTRMKTEKSMKSHKIASIVFAMYWSVIVFFTGEFTALLPLAFIQKTGKTLSIQAHYPYDWKSEGWYEVTFFSQALTQSFMGFSYGNADMFYVCALILTSGQFRLLAWEFENVIFTSLIDFGFDPARVDAFSKTFNESQISEGMEDGSDGNLSKISSEYREMVEAIESEEFAPFLKRRMVHCIENHQMLLDYCKLLNEFFAPLLLPCLSFALFYIIFIAFTLLVSTDSSSFMGLTEYLVTAIAEVFLMTLFGQILMNESDAIREAMYRSPWYLCPRKFLSIFKFSQMKASDSVAITAGSYFIMKLELFIALCKTAGSYFAVLRQVTE